MNILFLSELFYPHGSGAEYATLLYAELLSKSGFDVRVITNKFDDEPSFSKSGDLETYRLPLFPAANSVKYSILKRIDVLSSSFFQQSLKWADVVYIPRFWYSAIPVIKNLNKPVIVHLHDYTPICPLSTFYDLSKGAVCANKYPLCRMQCIYKFEKNHERPLFQLLSSITLNSTLARPLGKLIHLSDAIICVSNTQRDIVVGRIKSLKGKIIVINNPIAELPKTSATGVDFGYFGGSDLMKGIQVLFKAAFSLKRNNLRIHATNLGKVSLETTNSFKQVGIIPYSRLSSTHLDQLYEELRAVAVPSIVPETFSYVACEAALRGKLVIASTIGAIPEILNGCSGAFFFEPQNYQQLAERLVYVDGLSKEVAIDLGLKNRETLSKRLNNNITIKRFIKVCESVCQ